MADSQAYTGTPDTGQGNPVDVTTVTNANAVTVDRQTVAIGDPAMNVRAAVTADGLQVLDRRLLRFLETEAMLRDDPHCTMTGLNAAEH